MSFLEKARTNGVSESSGIHNSFEWKGDFMWRIYNSPVLPGAFYGETLEKLFKYNFNEKSEIISF